MKQFLLLAFCGLLLTASCKCNGDKDGADGADTTIVITDTPPDGAASGDGTEDANRYVLSEDDFVRMYDLESYSAEDVRRFRRLHDEMDWGTVSGYYPEGSTRVLTEDDTQYLTEWGHDVMLNEIYARHGKIFINDDLKSHFGRFDWYSPRYADVEGELTALEKQNIEFLMDHKPGTS